MNRWKSPQILIPLAVFIFSEIVFFFIAWLGNCWDYFSIECRMRWDTSLYLDVAEHGHTLFLCSEAEGFPPNCGKWCGNAGWAPLYPLFMRILHSLTGLSLPAAGMLLSLTFLLGYLLLSARLSGISDFSMRNWLICGIAAFTPGNIYFHAVFPLSQAVFFMALMLLMLKKNRYSAAGLAAIAGVLSYSIGFFLLAALGSWVLLDWIQTKKLNWKAVFNTFLPAGMGLIALFTYDQIVTGHWNALFMIQEKYGYSLNSPLKMLGIHMERLFLRDWGFMSWVEVQNTLVMGFILFLMFYLFRQKSHSERQMRSLYGFYLLFFWFLPYSASPNAGLYRNAAMLGPGFTFQIRTKPWLLAALLVALLWLSITMGVMFIQNKII